MSDFAPGSFSIGKGEWMVDQKFQDFASFLGLLERDARGVNWKADDKTRDKMKQIYLWASLKSKSPEHNDIKKAVFDLQKSVGVNWTGKILVDRLWQHTSFDAKFQKQLKKLSEHENQPVKEEKLKSRNDIPQKTEPAGPKPVKDVKIKEVNFKNAIWK